MSNKYTSLSQLDVDLEIFSKNPNDEVFLGKMIKKIDNSNNEMKEKIKEKIENQLMISNPLLLFEKIKQTLPEGYQLIIKNYEDPWFNC